MNSTEKDKADIEILRQYRDELAATLAGGGTVFAPRNAAGFRDALSRLIESVEPHTVPEDESSWYTHTNRSRRPAK